MSGSVNKVILVEAYASGLSIPQVAARFGLSQSTVRHHVKKAGILRTRAEGVRAAASEGRLGSGFRGKRRVFTDQHCAAIGDARRNWATDNASGTSIKPNGYVEYTMGEHKGRSVHVVAMEMRIGRRLRDDEVVHHIDGDKTNNKDNNLALMTRSGHSRLHRREERIARKAS